MDRTAAEERIMMRMNHVGCLAGSVATGALLATMSIAAQAPAAAQKPIPVDYRNFVRAESDARSHRPRPSPAPDHGRTGGRLASRASRRSSS